MKQLIDLEPDYLEIVVSILRQNLPVNATVWVFGSRAQGTAKRFSDIDLLIDAGQPLAIDLLAALANDFEESHLPYKVDIADASCITDSFREHIKQQLIMLPLS